MQKLKILAASAKYDVSCSSSGSSRSKKAGMLGDTKDCGVCHSFTADGRCISLLKVLLSNKCEYDCRYCHNRRSNDDAMRASFTVDELCGLVISFYRRNYIEGLFLSSAVEISPNATMERLADCVEILRTKYQFNGYIHLKGIPGADIGLIDRASSFVDRMSMNIELPTSESLKLLAPSKPKESILAPMKHLAAQYIVQKENRSPYLKRKIPAGQTTQMIIGATPDSDYTILKLTQNLYDFYRLKRVYYSAYIPVGHSSLPMTPPNLIRENRLYQADWLLRFYGFKTDEIVDENSNLPLECDPKAAWALRHPELFPVEINTAPAEILLRIPGIGLRGVYRIETARKHSKLTFESLKKMRITLKRAKHFITCSGKYYGIEQPSAELLTDLVPEQLNMFSEGLLAAHNITTLPEVFSGEI